MSTDDSTPTAGRHPATATEQAVFLTVLADHLLRHPHLPPVNITMRSHELLPELHILERDAPAVALAAWATSLGATELAATALPDRHAVGVTARIGPGHDVEVWTSIDGLPGGSYTLTVADLDVARLRAAPLADGTAGGAR